MQQFIFLSANQYYFVFVFPNALSNEKTICIHKKQWVWEVCFPTGTQEVNNGNDMKFMDDLLNKIEQDGIPAHAPLEQRWSASSSSLMSPAHGAPNGLHSWVGVINYLPSDETTMDPKIMQQQRDDITHLFQGKYCDLVRTVGTPYSATSHGAKLEMPNTVWKLVDLQLFLQQRFPVYQFNKARQLLDPKNLLSNHLIDSIFGKPPTPEKK